MYTLKYRSSRTDVWRWYWRFWRSRLWRRLAVLAAAAAFFIARAEVLHGEVLGWGSAALVMFVLLVSLSAVIPQLLFKSAERTLEVGPDGWSTRIGNKTGSRKWSELAPVREEDGAIVLARKPGNALLIPERAFESEIQRAEFLKDVKRWQAEAR